MTHEPKIQVMGDASINLIDYVVSVQRTEDDGVRELIRIDFHDVHRADVMNDIGAGLALIRKSLLSEMQKAFVAFWVGGFFMDLYICQMLREKGIDGYGGQ